MKKSMPKEAGFTFAELTFAMLILVVASAVLINHLSVNYSTTATERDRVFAFSKAQAILSEIQTFVDRGQVDAAVDLDVLDDGIVTRTPLTIQTEGGLLVSPDHPVSGNYQRDGQWLWSRRISVQPFLGLNNRNVRYVTVRVFRRDKDGNESPMADLSAVINSAGSAYPTTQVFDVYLLAIENIPGWWVFMDSIKPFVESMITDLENRNPGMTFRTHWITKAAFGRNMAYRPFINEADDSLNPLTEVYHYPGAMPSGSASSYYYVPDNIKARMNLDGADVNGYDADLNPHPYALADFYNHAMRYPDEYALWESRVEEIENREDAIAAAIASGDPVPDELTDMSKEPTMRILLDEMNTDPQKFKNALVINLHGELLPMPALRNFSDAAKDPISHPNWRCVTHPEELRTKKDDAGVTDPLRFRMYAYTDYPQYYSGVDRMSEPMIVEIMGVNLVDSVDPTKLVSAATLQNIPGGVSVGGISDYAFTWQAAKHLSDSPLVTEEMYYTAEYIYDISDPRTEEPRTRIYLYNTPLSCGQDVNSRGLANSERARLYQMEYVPSPVAAGPSFTAADLTTTGTGTKNTARWTLNLDPSILTSSMFVESAGGTTYNPTGDVQLQVRTRIASNHSGGSTDWEISGTMFPAMMQPDNLSTTYAWWADSASDVPMTERAQFNGDPRHLPYMDCFSGGDDFADSYNWYHDSLNNSSEPAQADFGSINGTYLRNRWGSSMWCDVPRYFELLRGGLVESASIYTSLTGWSYYYLGIGNDIGYDSANGYPNSIPSDLTPHGSSGSGYINTITGQRKCILVPNSAFGSNYWTGFPWLGELYPDSLAATFLDTGSGTVRGNLPAGTSSDLAFQYRTNTAYAVSGRLAYGTVLYDNHQRTAGDGCSAFFNIGSSSTRFRHMGSSGNGTLTSVGQEVADNYSMTMPSTAPVSRPFSLTYAGSGGDHWNYPPYSTRYTGSLYETYYTHGSGTGSGLVKLTNPAGTSAGYVVVNGIDKAVTSGTTFIAKWAVLSLAHSFFEAGDTSNTLRIPQLARVEIASPTDITELNDPSQIDVLFGTSWTRWDGLPYTQTGTFVEDESLLEYAIMYSNDNGATWRFVQDDTITTIGEPPANSMYLESDTGVGDETYTWDTPAGSFPEGSYLLRVECYRDGAQVHYAWHQSKIFIQR
tara:strand:+ start:95099 stop:98599 length:3501 start_codon:yes stop_codon:yes gene_type:complete